MKVIDRKTFESLLATESLAELRQAVVHEQLAPNLPQVSRLQKHLSVLSPSPPGFRVGIVHTYTSELLDPWLKFYISLQGMSAEIYHAPYGVTLQESQAGSGLQRHSPELTLLMLQPGDLHPGLALSMACHSPSERREIQHGGLVTLQSIVSSLRECVGGQLVVTLLPLLRPPSLGLFDISSEKSEAVWWMEFKQAFCHWGQERIGDMFFLDMDQLVQRVGRNCFFDDRFWYSSRFPFSAEGASTVANAISSIAAVQKLPRVKVIVLDADNTLWGGVIGEDGMHGIALGPEYPGNIFVDFQKRLLSLQQRGFLLALCSKNNPEDVKQVLNEHPHQVLKAEHFAAQRVNWLTKPENLMALAQEMNLGLESFVFVDDSDHECAAVRHSLEAVEVVQVPGKYTDIPSCLDGVARLEILSLTKEDSDKTAMYAQEKLRQEQLKSYAGGSGDINEYLMSLNMKMSVFRDDLSHLKRLAQLTQKTNQFNLTTRRYTEQNIRSYIEDEKAIVYHFSLADNFGDSGVVGLAILLLDEPGWARLDTFLMSCRVIGRKAEQAFLSFILDDLREKDINKLQAEYIPTAKNMPAKMFLSEMEFVQEDSGLWTLDLQDDLALSADVPITIMRS